MIHRRVVSESFVPAATLVGALLVWEGAVPAFRIPRFVMPAPAAILAEGWDCCRPAKSKDPPWPLPDAWASGEFPPTRCASDRQC